MRDQQDLFGGETKPAYTPKPEHVRNALHRLFQQMQAARTWPWDEVVAEIHVERTVPYLIGLLEDCAEAEGWRQRFAHETARLQKAA